MHNCLKNKTASVQNARCPASFYCMVLFACLNIQALVFPDQSYKDTNIQNCGEVTKDVIFPEKQRKQWIGDLL